VSGHGSCKDLCWQIKCQITTGVPSALRSFEKPDGKKKWYEQIGVFLKNQCYDPNFAKTRSILNKNAIFSLMVWRKCLKIITSVPSGHIQKSNQNKGTESDPHLFTKSLKLNKYFGRHKNSGKIWFLNNKIYKSNRLSCIQIAKKEIISEQRIKKYLHIQLV
jgi:hypothetical protein